MSGIEIEGLRPLNGDVRIQGSKNAVLPMMAAAVLHRGTTVLENVPRIQDVFCMTDILTSMGCRCRMDGHRLEIDARTVSRVAVPREYVASMRSSIVLLGALLGRTGEAATYYPGGCSIGSRPIDLHLYGLERLGAEIAGQEDGRIAARADKLTGGRIRFPYPSVGATENVLLAAAAARGTTVIEGAAREPEIVSLCRMLSGMGAKISGIGEETVTVEGVNEFHDSEYAAPGDRIVTGTYMSCVMAAGGRAFLRGTDAVQLRGVTRVLRRMGAEIEEAPSGIRVGMARRPGPVKVRTAPYPGFPTDLQSPMLSLLSVSDGCGQVLETVFEGRFATAVQLRRMGACIDIEGNKAEVRGIYPLRGACVTAPDLRGGAALAVAGLAAEGKTRIGGCAHILRGYEDICGDLKSLGAWIRQLPEAEEAAGERADEADAEAADGRG